DDSFASTSIMQASGAAFNMMQAGGLPRSSLNAKVITTHADLKLTNQTTKDLILSGAFKYNERDNQTDSNTYLYKNLANDDYTAVNTPYSNRKTQYELAADYRLAKGQNIRLAYERENIRRWCDGVVSGAQCVASPSSDEDKLEVTYRLKAREDVHLNASYSYAKRRADFDHSFLANVDPEPVINAEDRLGFAAYPYADRKQNLVKAGVNWQATEKLDMSLSSRYAKDNYDAVLGVQDGHSIGINLDATYSYNENSSISAYASWQNGMRDLRNGFDGSETVAPTKIWTNRLEDTSNVVGLNARHNGLMKGKLEILGDLSYSLDRSEYSTKVPYLATCGAANVLSCGSAPDIRSEVITLKLTGNYQVNKHGKIAIGYIFEHRNTNDYFFNGLQFGSTPNRVIPTGEQAPNYSVNVVTASYVYTF
ncbi:MAG: MtrB/PioB family decaheme-associated outer membrane protein, partial [Pseudomonadota bacterium]|nr:MtrB/PioB family decaheme-associated outer membrane protein [Pseudomonadota bacterium]